MWGIEKMTRTPSKLWQKVIPRSKGKLCGVKVNINGETLTIASQRTGLVDEALVSKDMMVKQYAVPSDGRQEIKVMLVFRPKEMVEDER
jgi:hypothetical protein